MKVQKSLLLFIAICFILSLAATLTSYDFYYTNSRVVDAAFVYRGWPLYWIVEFWSFWSQPPYVRTFQFQWLNFFVDVVFWAVVFQLPSAVVLLLRKTRI